MTQLIGRWVLSITGAALITGIAMAVTPKGKSRTMVSLVCSLVMIAALVSPVLEFDYDSYAQYMVDYNYNLDSLTESLETENERLTRLIIQEQSAAYILDKAANLDMTGLTIQVDTQLDSEGNWYPWFISITGEYTERQSGALSEYVAGTFGIPAQRQYWSTHDERQ